MQRSLLSILAIFSGLLFFQCEPEQTPPPPRGFIAILPDPSGTTAGKGWPMPDSVFFRQTIDSLAAAGGGDLYVYNLGFAIPQPCSLLIKPVIVNQNVYDSQYNHIEEQNRKAGEWNREQTGLLMACLDSFLFRYRPPADDDYSYILPAVNSLSNTLNAIGPEYGYCAVLLYTDMINHEKGKSPARVTADQWRVLTEIPHTDIYLCSYADTSGYHALRFNMCGSYREFPRMIPAVRNRYKQPY